MAAHVLSYDLTADGTPHVIDAVCSTHLFRVIQRCRAVAVRDDKDVLCREDLNCRRERGANDVGRFVLCKNGGQNVVLYFSGK